MRNRFDRQLLELNNELIQMGSLIEQAIEMGISAPVSYTHLTLPTIA